MEEKLKLTLDKVNRIMINFFSLAFRGYIISLFNFQ